MADCAKYQMFDVHLQSEKNLLSNPQNNFNYLCR